MARFRTFSLSGLLPASDTLLLDTRHNVLSLLHEGSITEQEVLTDMEMTMIVTLLSSYPNYTPNEELLAAFTGEDVEDARDRLNDATESGDYDTIMRPVRNLLSRCRLKLRPFKIKLVSLLETGYQLMCITFPPHFRTSL